MTMTELDPNPSFDYWWDMIEVDAVLISMAPDKGTCRFQNPNGMVFEVDLFTELAHVVPSTQ